MKSKSSMLVLCSTALGKLSACQPTMPEPEHPAQCPLPGPLTSVLLTFFEGNEVYNSIINTE